MPTGDTFVIAMPVPNITGELHIGHALNLVLQDAVARYVRQQGRPVSFRPGVDHAGLNGQLAAEKALAAAGIDRSSLGREAFGGYMRAWHDEYQARLLGAMRDLGISADWDEAVSSIDQERIRLIRSAFAAMVDAGIVYRELCLVGWCTHCSTCIPNEEMVRNEVTHTAYHIQVYDEAGRAHLLVTLDPLLMLAATGLRTPPAYEGAEAGLRVRLPAVGRDVAVEAAGEARERALGSGLSLVLPSYNADDFEAAVGRGEAVRPFFNPDGTVCLPGHDYDGMTPAVARAHLVAELERDGHILGTEPYLHGEAHHDACGGAVVPRPTRQWLIRLESLAGIAADLAAHPPTKFNAPMWEERVDKVIRGVEHGGEPRNPWWEGACLAFVQGFTSNRDWMISRQNWWGIPIPVLECADCGSWLVSDDAVPAECGHCGQPLRASDDVFDVLFHSALWAYCVAPDPDAPYHADLAVVGHDILEFWIPVANLLSEAVFARPSIAAVLVHGLICDETGKKMSKSVGNVVSLTDMLSCHGTEAVRALVLGLQASTTSEFVPIGSADVAAAVEFAGELVSWCARVERDDHGRRALVAATLDRAHGEVAARMADLDVPGAYQTVRRAAEVVQAQSSIEDRDLTRFASLLEPFHPGLAEAINARRSE